MIPRGEVGGPGLEPGGSALADGPLRRSEIEQTMPSNSPRAIPLETGPAREGLDLHAKITRGFRSGSDPANRIFRDSWSRSCDKR